MPAIYQADVWCDSCADEIRKRIQAEGNAPENPEDSSSYDSDDYPKYMDDDEEADTPQHCGSHENCLEAVTLPSGRKIGALLSTNLTNDGVDYVREQCLDGGEVADFWREQFRDYDIPPAELTDEAKAAYVKSPHHCPYCKSDNLEGGKVEWDEPIRVAVYCNACGQQWYDVLQVVGINTIE